MSTTSQPNVGSQELSRLFYQTKKTLPILNYKDMADESVKHVLNTFVGYEPNHESPPFSIDDAKDVTANIISVNAAIQDPKYRLNPNRPEICLRRFMKAHSVDYIKETYSEGIHFTRDETTPVSLKHPLWLLKLQGATEQKIQQVLRYTQFAERSIIQF